jgi:hypothetical protein
LLPLFVQLHLSPTVIYSAVTKVTSWFNTFFREE